MTGDDSNYVERVERLFKERQLKVQELEERLSSTKLNFNTATEKVSQNTMLGGQSSEIAEYHSYLKKLSQQITVLERQLNEAQAEFQRAQERLKSVTEDKV